MFQIPQLQNSNNNNIYFLGLLWELNETIG